MIKKVNCRVVIVKDEESVNPGMWIPEVFNLSRLKTERGGEESELAFVHHKEATMAFTLVEARSIPICMTVSPSEEFDHSICEKEQQDGGVNAEE